jgi:DNA-binding CsgD family transcriptional regulator
MSAIHFSMQRKQRCARANMNPLLRVEGEVLSYTELGARLQLSEATVRAAVRKARRLKSGLTWASLTVILQNL